MGHCRSFGHNLIRDTLAGAGGKEASRVEQDPGPHAAATPGGHVSSLEGQQAVHWGPSVRPLTMRADLHSGGPMGLLQTIDSRSSRRMGDLTAWHGEGHEGIGRRRTAGVPTGAAQGEQQPSDLHADIGERTIELHGREVERIPSDSASYTSDATRADIAG